MTSPAGAAARRPGRRRPNGRGQGERLRDDLISAAMTLIEAKQHDQSRLRGIACQIGIAATSVYLHFPDVDRLLAAATSRSSAQTSSS
jgi:AcrR family transcriptional regulator